MDNKSKEKIDSLVNSGYEGIVLHIDHEPIIWRGVDAKGQYQAELISSWDDRKIGRVRVSCFLTYTNRRWWEMFTTRTIYDKVFNRD